MDDYFYVLKQDGGELYLADAFYQRTWTKSLSRAKRFMSLAAARHAMCKQLATHDVLVAVWEMTPQDLEEDINQEAASGKATSRETNQEAVSAKARTGSVKNDNPAD